MFIWSNFYEIQSTYINNLLYDVIPFTYVTSLETGVTSSLRIVSYLQEKVFVWDGVFFFRRLKETNP